MTPAIPPEALLHHIAILGKTGSGKTVTAKGAAETILDEGRRFCALDPTGAWWGMRLKPDGKSAAYPVVIFGGEHADVDLGEVAGAKLAQLIAEGSFSSIIDTSRMTVGARTRFFTDFGEALFRANKRPLHLIIDEAHLFAPQGKIPDPQSGRMVHAANNLVSGGRSRGLRIILISQRPAKLHKDSLTQVETLIAMRLLAPQDRAAVEAWIGEWADPKKGKELLNSLPSLPNGTGWIWSPEIDVLKRVTFPMIRTFDSSRTPEDGETIETPSDLGDIDLEGIRASLSGASNEVAEINTPKAAAAAIQPHHVARARQEGFEEGRARGYELGYADALAAACNAINAIPVKVADAGVTESVKPSVKSIRAPTSSSGRTSGFGPEKPRSNRGVGTNGLDGAAVKLLDAFKRYGARGLTWDEACIVAGLVPGNGYFYGGKKRLTESGYLSIDGETMRANGVPGTRDEPATRSEILRTWSKLKQPAPRMLEYLVLQGARGVTVDEMANAIGAKPGNGYWYGGVAQLRNANLIVDQKSILKLSPFVVEARQ